MVGREAWWTIPEPCSWLCAWNCVFDISASPKIENYAAPTVCEIISLSALPRFGTYSFTWYLSSWHKTSEFIGEPRKPTIEALWLWKCKGIGEGRAECKLYLLQILPSPWANFWQHWLQHRNWCLESRWVYRRSWLSFQIMNKFVCILISHCNAYLMFFGLSRMFFLFYEIVIICFLLLRRFAS